MRKCSVIIPSGKSAHAFDHVGDRTSMRACLKLAAQTAKKTGHWVRVVRTAVPGKGAPGYGYAKTLASCSPRERFVPRTRAGENSSFKRHAQCTIAHATKRGLKKRKRR